MFNAQEVSPVAEVRLQGVQESSGRGHAGRREDQGRDGPTGALLAGPGGPETDTPGLQAGRWLERRGLLLLRRHAHLPSTETGRTASGFAQGPGCAKKNVPDRLSEGQGQICRGEASDPV